MINQTTTLTVIAIVSALGLLGVVGITLWIEIVEAAKPPNVGKGCRTSTAANASLGRCVR